MVGNERLRGSIASARMRPSDLAECIGVDPKTVERWITKGRQPHRAHRLAVARSLDVDEAYLWPETLTQQVTLSASVAELLELHPTRSSVPHGTWQQLIGSARDAIDILTYAGTFLVEQHNIAEVLRDKAGSGVHCRYLVGDETSDAVRLRAREEGTSGGLEGRIQLNRAAP